MDGNMPNNTEKECKVVKKINAEGLYCKAATLGEVYNCFLKFENKTPNVHCMNIWV